MQDMLNTKAEFSQVGIVGVSARRCSFPYDVSLLTPFTKNMA